MLSERRDEEAATAFFNYTWLPISKF
jgi:hypothetical protein